MQSGRFFLALFLIVVGVSTGWPDNAIAYNFKPLEAAVNKAVKDSVFPCASLAVLYKGKVVFHKAFGKLTYDSHSAPADTSTMYDLASLTKAVSTTSIAMQLVERDSLDIHARVSHYLPAFTGNGKEKITIEHLMRHTSGLRAHILFSKSCKSQRIMDSTGPPQSLTWRIAPVEKDTLWPFKTVKRPLVNDQNAALLGGVAGHAGLYATTGDLQKFVSMLMNGGTLNNHTYIQKATLKKFLSRKDSQRALGWDVPSGHSSAGDYYSYASYGHLGYTGTSIWIDPEKELAVIFLSNRVYPTSENIKIRAFRPLLHNTVANCLNLKKAADKAP